MTAQVELKPIELPANLQNQLGAYLQPNEKAVWYAKPEALALLTLGLTSVLGFVLVLVIAVLALIFLGLTLKIGLLYVPAAFLGLVAAIIAAVIFSGYGKAKAVAYVLTERRAFLLNSLLKDGGQIVPVKVYDQSNLSEIELVPGQSGLGSVYFAQEDYQDAGGTTRQRKVGFEAIKNAAEVQAQVRQVLSSQ
jgi:energy-coupling factor transporter transmembrane protein EcfT